MQEGDTGDVISMSTDGIEARISVLEHNNGKVKPAIKAPADTRVECTVPNGKKGDQENFRQELLLF